MIFKTILSKNNLILKQTRSLLDKKGRKEYDLMLVEGKKMIADLIKLNVMPKQIFFSPKSQEFVESLQISKNVELILLENNIIAELTHQTTSQEVVAVVPIPKSKPHTLDTNFLVLDGLQDAGNVGTILRTALACDFRTIYLIDCVDCFSPKVVDASMTAVFHLNLIKITRQKFCEIAIKRNFFLLSADFGGENALTYRPPCDIIGIIIGNEGNGVSDEVNSVAKKVITLPMNKDIESLNASVCAGILMYKFASLKF